jgi:hypothetical protein
MSTMSSSPGSARGSRASAGKSGTGAQPREISGTVPVIVNASAARHTLLRIVTRPNLIHVVALVWSVGLLGSPARADPLPLSKPRSRVEAFGGALASAWTFWEAPMAGGSALVPRVQYVGPINRGFRISAECRGSGPSIYISIDSPNSHLQRLRFDVLIPVVFRTESKSSLTIDSVRVTARLTGGYTANTNRITIGMALADAARAISLIDGNAETSAPLLVVEVAGAAGTFNLTGARDTFALLKRACKSRKL